MPSEMVRIGEMGEAERNLVNFLTPEERRDAMVRAARVKQRRNDEMLMADYLRRVLSGEIAPSVMEPEGTRPWKTNGRGYFIKNGDVLYTSIGRVPNHETMHVLKGPDGSLTVMGMYWLREEDDPHPWSDWLGSSDDD